MPDRLMQMLSGILTDDDLARSAIVTEVNTDGTLDLRYMGGILLNVPCISTYTPTTGDVVQVMRRGPGSLLVIGAVRTTNVAGGTVASDFVISYNIGVVPTAITGGGTAGSSGTATFMPVSAGSYRRTDGWSRSDVRQGVYYTSSQLGYYHGGWFYGSGAFNSLKGRTITRVRIYLERQGGAGNYALMPVHLYAHKNATKPTGDVYYIGHQLAAPKLAAPGNLIVDLPTSFGVNLATGYAKGIGVLYNGTTDYMVLSSIAQYANSGRLDISWRED